MTQITQSSPRNTRRLIDRKRSGTTAGGIVPALLSSVLTSSSIPTSSTSASSVAIPSNVQAPPATSILSGDANSSNNSHTTTMTTTEPFNFATNATLWLLIWTANNVGVTLLNKAVFSGVNFRYPFFLSAIHMVCCLIGANWIFYSLDASRARRSKLLSSSTVINTTTTGNDNNNNHTEHHDHSRPPLIEQILGSNIVRHPLDPAGLRLMMIFSVVFSLNIAVGNVSLKYVSVNFNQVMRSLVPAITIAMGVCLGKPASKRRIIAVIPIVIGVAMACFGDMSYTTFGFFVTVACIVLAALKVVASGELLTGKVSLHPVDLLAHMAPLALIQCMALALVTGELSAIFTRFQGKSIFNPQAIYPTFAIIMSGFCSFSLNICSLQANKLTSPLTLCIAANVKQVLMIAFSTIIFGTEITPLNGAGILVVLIGSARYSYISIIDKQQQQQQQQSSTSKTVVTQPDGKSSATTATHSINLEDEESSIDKQEMVSLLTPRYNVNKGAI